MNEFFGGMFDFNNDGSTDAIEAALGLQIISETEEEGDGEEDDCDAQGPLHVPAGADARSLRADTDCLSAELAALQPRIRDLAADTNSLLGITRQLQLCLPNEPCFDACRREMEGSLEALEQSFRCLDGAGNRLSDCIGALAAAAAALPRR